MDDDCSDGDACTTDTCGADHTCRHSDVACPPTEVCVADATQAHCCPETRRLWDGAQCAECTPSNLTLCAELPNAMATCDGEGSCGYQCLEGWGNCGAGAGCETNLMTDSAHCGRCDHACPDNEQCRNGTCCNGLQPVDDLQAAIDAADPGATLRLCSGTWALTSTIEINKNLTLRGAGNEQTILDGGGAVRVLSIANGASVTLQDLQISRGHATGTVFLDQIGGGIFNDGTLTLANVIVTGNSAAAYGGGIYNTSEAPMLILEAGSILSGNSAAGHGGGLYNFLGPVTLRDSSVTGNTAFNGGGIDSGGTLTLQNSRVTNNTADHLGGGIYGGGRVTLEGSSVMGNSAGTNANPGYGGGINYFSRGTLTLKNGSTVANNSADSGGGILTSQAEATITLEESSVAGNTVTNSGGGISNGGSLILKAGSSVTDNHATNIGGGITNLSTLTLEAGSTVTGNSAGSGGGIHNYGTVTLAAADIVTENHLADGTTVSNCAPENTIPNCMG